MKKYLALLIVFVTIVGAFAQTSPKKAYTAIFVMPDFSVQKIALYADQDGKNQFLRIVEGNRWNTALVVLNRKPVQTGDVVKAANQHFITESQAYRFLAHQLCESCGTENAIDKSTGAYIFTKSDSGILNMIDIYWLDDYQKWCISITPNIDVNYHFNSKKDRPIFF
jgi:hypothetical protein